MKPDEFEQRLRRQPLRQVPPNWRAEILAAAPVAESATRAARRPPQSWLSTIKFQLSALLWPHPQAWAGLAAVWILILVLNVSMRNSMPRLAEKSAPPSPEMIAELKKQQRMFAELMGPREMAVAVRPKIFSPQPRSGRVEFLVG